MLDNAHRELSNAEQKLSHRMDRETSRGLAAVRRIKHEQHLDGVYGTLAELLAVNERYSTAVEVTAGNSLFHYVVDNDETATQILERLNKDRLGRVTFMPLNRLRPKTGNIPKTNDSIPMMEKIQFDPTYEKAFQQVFGKIIICPNLAIAAQYARSHGVSAITMEGDRSDKKGALTGGYHDPRQSRLEAVSNVAKWRNEYEAHKSRSMEIKRALDQKDQEITRAVGQLQKLEQIRQKQEGSYGPLRQELQSKVTTLQNQKDALDAKQRALAHIQANEKALSDQQSAHEAEANTEFKKALTRDEETQLENLSSTVQDLRRQYSEVSASRSELEARKSELEIELRENLRPRLDQLSAQDFENQDGAVDSLGATERELTRISQAMDSVEKKLQEIEESIDQSTAQITELEQRHAEIRRQQDDIAKGIERQQKRMEKSMQKKALLTKQAAEVSARIRDLGVLPQEAFARFEKTKSDALVKRLHKVNDSLKKYSHVNKKAFQQYDQFTTQRDTLTKRRAELDSSQASIEELITVLDQRKDEAIERTFKQVSREFANVFEKLVPAGRGRLVIQRKTDRQQAEEEEEDSDEERRESVENYTGVGISVSFNSKHDDQQRIQQLSGGQKSMSSFSLFPILPFPLLILIVQNQASALSPSSSPSSAATPHPSTSLTKSTPTSTPSTGPPSRRCCNRSLGIPRRKGSSSARLFARRCCSWRKSATGYGMWARVAALLQ